MTNSNKFSNESPLLSMQNVSKTFGPVKALSKVNLTVEKGEVHTLMGENGAGKSTLMKILTGAYTPNSGSEIEFGGHKFTSMTPTLSRKLGIAVIYQELALAPNMTVAENIFLGREMSTKGLLDRRTMRVQTDGILKALGVSFTANVYVSELSLGQRQEVEIARALAQNAKLIVMDEPTTSLSKTESDRLFKVINDLRSKGIAIVYISHRMEEIYALSDRCTVLRDGVTIGTLERENLSEEKLVQMMVGREVSGFYRSNKTPFSKEVEPVFEVKNLNAGELLHGCSFDCKAGEVVGLSGLVGSGRTELARSIFGADPRDSGTILLDGKEINPKNPADAMKLGLTYLTEDRKELGIFSNMSVSDNINISVLQNDAVGLLFRDFGKAKNRTDSAITELSIKTDSGDTKIANLSGGNQQKALLARMLECKPKVLILDEPTRGVDIGAKSEIYAIIEQLAKRGTAIIVISSDLPEVAGICDRVLVMHNGTIVGAVHPDEQGTIQAHEIMNISTGANKPTNLPMNIKNQESELSA